MAVVVRGSRANPDKPVIKIISSDGNMGELVVDLTSNDDPKLHIVSVAQPVEVLLRSEPDCRLTTSQKRFRTMPSNRSSMLTRVRAGGILLLGGLLNPIDYSGYCDR